MLDAITRHQIWLQRYANGRFNDILPIIKKMRDDLSVRLLTATPFQIARINILLSELDGIIDTAITKMQTIII